MALLQDIFENYALLQLLMTIGGYPYLSSTTASPTTEVLMDGKKVSMFGSKAYMGLTCD